MTQHNQPKYLICLNIDGSGTHKMAYHEYGNQNLSHVVLCIHGLSRNSSDFHSLCIGLEDKFRVVSVDVVGRGYSSFIKTDLYSYKQYVSDTFQILNHLSKGRTLTFDIVGSSMGGLIGLMVAKNLSNYTSSPFGPSNNPLIFRKLILNDIGPKIPSNGMKYLKTLDLHQNSFPTLELAQNEIKNRSSRYGQIPKEQWEYMFSYTIHEIRGDPSLKDGFYLRYDPTILGAKPAESKPNSDSQPKTESNSIPQGDFELWNLWDQLQFPVPSLPQDQEVGFNNCGVLSLHGKSSAIFTTEVHQEMEKRKLPSLLYEYHCFEECGHIPSLMSEEHIKLVKNFLTK